MFVLVACAGHAFNQFGMVQGVPAMPCLRDNQALVGRAQDSCAPASGAQSPDRALAACISPLYATHASTYSCSWLMHQRLIFCAGKLVLSSAEEDWVSVSAAEQDLKKKKKKKVSRLPALI